MMLRFLHIAVITVLFCGSMQLPVRAAPLPAGAAQDRAANLPDATAVANAFKALRGWLDEFTLPGEQAVGAKQSIPGAGGVCIILRRSGRVLGTGIDSTPDELMLRRAAAHAMSEVLGDPALRRVLTRLGSDKATLQADIDQLQREIGRSITIELEVAGKLMPLIGTSLNQMARKLDPGIDGAAIRNQEVWQFAFPASLRATNTLGDPERMLQNLVLMSGYPLKEIESISQRDDAGLYSFRCVTLAQSVADGQPNQTFRGDTIVPINEVTLDTVGQTADGIARHLINSMWPEPAKDEAGNWIDAPRPLGFMGDYQVVADEYKPLLAPPLEQALAALALSRYGQAPRADRDTAAAATQAALRALRDLAQVTDGEEDPRADPLACAAVVLAASEIKSFRNDAAIKPLFDAAAQNVLNAFSPEGRPQGTLLLVMSNSGSPFAHAIMASALARLFSLNSSIASPADSVVRQSLDMLWQATPREQHVALLPWIGWAEVEYARFANRPLAHHDDFEALIDVLLKSQIGVEHLDRAFDLEGGFSLQSDATIGGILALPTSQSLRPATWLAGLTSDPIYAQVMPAADQLRTHQMRSMRFLMQLTMREQQTGAIVRNPKRCLGGVRQSLWSSTQPVAAQAMGLLAASETLKSLAHGK